MYIYKTTIKLHDTDAAGLLFFANQFKIAHDAYQAFMESLNISFTKILKEKDFLVPIVHASSDYKLALAVSDPITVKLQVDSIGETSFTLKYDLFRNENELVGSVKTVHVAIDTKNKEKINLPEKLRALLNQQI